MIARSEDPWVCWKKPWIWSPHRLWWCSYCSFPWKEHRRILGLQYYCQDYDIQALFFYSASIAAPKWRIEEIDTITESSGFFHWRCVAAGWLNRSKGFWNTHKAGECFWPLCCVHMALDLDFISPTKKLNYVGLLNVRLTWEYLHWALLLGTNTSSSFLGGEEVFIEEVI